MTAERIFVKDPRREAAIARLMRVMPEFRRLRAFTVVAEELHYRRAARRLNITQSPLSRIIVSLEHDLGVTLFERSRHGVRLTVAGAALHQDVGKVLEEAVELFQRTAESIDTVSAESKVLAFDPERSRRAPIEMSPIQIQRL